MSKMLYLGKYWYVFARKQKKWYILPVVLMRVSKGYFDIAFEFLKIHIRLMFIRYKKGR